MYFFVIFTLFIVIINDVLGLWDSRSLQWSFWQLQGKFLSSFFHILGENSNWLADVFCLG